MVLFQTLKYKLVGDDMNTIGKRTKYLPTLNDPLSAVRAINTVKKRFYEGL